VEGKNKTREKPSPHKYHEEQTAGSVTLKKKGRRGHVDLQSSEGKGEDPTTLSGVVPGKKRGADSCNIGPKNERGRFGTGEKAASYEISGQGEKKQKGGGKTSSLSMFADPKKTEVKEGPDSTIRPTEGKKGKDFKYCDRKGKNRRGKSNKVGYSDLEQGRVQ